MYLGIELQISVIMAEVPQEGFASGSGVAIRLILDYHIRIALKTVKFF